MRPCSEGIGGPQPERCIVMPALPPTWSSFRRFGGCAVILSAPTRPASRITASRQGIGAGLAAMLADEGARVALAARRGELLEQVAAEICRAGGTAIPVVTDLTDDDSLARLLDRTRAELGPVDVLVNNAGFGLWKPLEATTIAEWDHTFAVNVRTAAWLCAAVLPGMQQRRFGRVNNVGSQAGVAIVPGLAAYRVSKHVLGALTEVIQDANHDNGIKSWVVCPASSTPRSARSSPAPTAPATSTSVRSSTWSAS
jgi:NADP-dependent 3-hydroxy acid dehydrogenase YdfG